MQRGGGPLRKLDEWKEKLQRSLTEAVVTDYEKGIEKAIKVLKEFFKTPQAPVVTGPGLLDFTCKQTNDLLKNDKEKVKKFLEYSPLMVAVEKGNKDRVGMLIEKGASVAYRNKVNF